ncbi:death-associated protein kinase 1-like isoform X2 [Oscarella lobularis]|uniref:death-associated protein kinase 1-like isoform X2 n=1 Tax=Oscarella lobularis TaxID=121494 RepID=UPI0033132E55
MGASATKKAIDRLAKIIEKGNEDEWRGFLSAEKGFQSSHFDPRLSLFHYVAGREFDSAEEADDWLTYAIVQKNQVIEKESDLICGQLRPLNCACLWGNIFGVEWLVSHGATVKVKASIGRTPYSHACCSSFDTMKKMLYLEEHGYILSPSEIVWAAEIQFSSFEKANEIFHHLVNEKGLSVSATDWDEWTPLHRACWHGSIFGVKWLVEHKADINSVNKMGTTPFMLACSSSINRSEKVRYLGEKVANCQAKDHRGKTALFHATNPSKCEDDEVKDVLRYLVIVKGIDINSVDKEGMTPLLYACYQFDSSFLVIQQLIELGADVSATDQNGKTPYEVARDGKIRALLREHYDAARFSVLQREKVPPDSIKFCVVGSEKAGKTTYVNSLLQLNEPPPKDEDRTPGVDIHNCENEKIGKGSWWDFGAQPTFHSAHGLFFQKSNTVFTLVLPIREKILDETFGRLLEEGQFWCAFTKASMRTRLSDEKSLIRLVVIFNLIGFNEEAELKVCVKLEQVAKLLQEKFQKTFDISHVIEMDCSKSQSDCMKDCREKMKRIREEMLKTAVDVPKLCHAIEEYLSLPDEKRKSPLAYFVTRDEFEKWVAKEVGITLNEDERKVAVEYLESSGIIINVGRRICVRPVWLCHNVIGPLLAPHWFLFGMPREKFGKASKEDIESALRAFESYLKKKETPSPFVVTADEAIEVLRFLELCYPLDGKPGVYQITALLDDKMPRNAWYEDSTLDMYRGQRYECAQVVDIISPSSFVILQCRCYHMPNVRHRAWKNGIKLIKIVDDKEVECLITMGTKMSHYCIDVIVRLSSNDRCEAVAKEFLDQLKSMIARVCDERSPGVILDWFYLDSSHLQRRDEDPAIYSARDVDQKVNDKAFDHKLFSARPEGEIRSRIRDLVILVPGTGRASVSFPADDEPVSDALMKACASIDGSKWETLAIDLDISLNDRTNIGEFTRDNFARMFKVLELWKKQSRSSTVGQLLRSFREFIGISRRAIEKKFNELSGQ